MMLLLPRAFAYIVDAIVLHFLWAMYPESLIFYTPDTTMILLATAYMAVMEIAMDATIGKKIVGLRVETIDGDSPSAISLIIRNLLKAAGIHYFFVTYFTVPFFGKALHDMVARTDIEEDYGDDDEEEDEYDEDED